MFSKPNKIKIVLVATTHPGNIGATARAMKTMGLSRLCLVNPKIFPHVEVTARAAGADDILANAEVVTDLTTALNGCRLIIGTSTRQRDLPLPLLDARAAAAKIIAETTAQQHQVAVVFGRESNGLSNEELLQCHYHLYIPSNPDFSSLNIAAAVQIVAYEIMMAQQAISPTIAVPAPTKEQDVPATPGEMRLFYEHLEKVLTEVEFLKSQKSKKLLPRLRRLFNRARPEHLEVNILRGILTAIQKTIQHHN